jgi:hypothetical protein
MPLFDFYIMVDWSGAARERGTFLVRVTRGGLPLHPTKTSASAIPDRAGIPHQTSPLD